MRRVGRALRFSDSPFNAKGLAVRRLPRSAALEEDVDATVVLLVRDWSVYRYTLFAEFRIEPVAGQPAPVGVLVLFSSCAIQLPFVRHGYTSVAVPIPSSHEGQRVGLAIQLAGGRTVVDWVPGERAMVDDPAAALFDRFSAELRARLSGRVLEIGSRARSGNEYTHIVPSGWEYVGMDVKEGPNVDIVGDAHELAAVVGAQRFDAVFAISVFEHLVMPWKVAVEMNKVLNVGGLVFIATHQSYPLHDVPWDFWRFSDTAWPALFNAATGFEVVDVAHGQRATVVPWAANLATWTVGPHPAWLLSTVLARKTGEATVSWPVDVADLIQTAYPT
jgi:hypothetical protein